MSTSPLRDYEAAFASMIGVRRAFGFWKGRVALYAILRGLGIGEGDEVVVPGYTCVMAVNPIMYVGAKPIFVDIEPVTYNIDPNLLAAKITPRTRLIIAQHTYGYPADLGAIQDIATRKGLPLVEDCCLALGSRYKGRIVGTFGIASYFSFQWNKPYTSGLGGIVVTDDDELAKRIELLCQKELIPPTPREVRMLRSQLVAYRTLVYPWTTAMAENIYRYLTRKGLVVGSSKISEFYPVMDADFFKGMSEMQALSGLRQLRKNDRVTAYRKAMMALYDELLAGRGWSMPVLPPDLDPVLVRYPIRVADKERALAKAAQRFIELGSWFECPLHPKETRLDAYGYHTGMCPEADRACREVVNLPLHPRTSEATIRRSVAFVIEAGLARADKVRVSVQPRTFVPTGAANRPVDKPRNAISIDVEDWLQSTIDPSLPLTDRFVQNTHLVLEDLESRGVRGTFFILGLAAEKAPGLIRRIQAAGHEIQSHGYGHQMVYTLTPAEFRQDLERSKKLLEDLTGHAITGYRAPAFEITLDNLWALDVIVESGYEFDSSVFPLRTFRYGIQNAPWYPHRLKTPSGYELLEMPVASCSLLGVRLPVAGGGYFRLLPYPIIRAGLQQLNRSGCGATIYLHPYEYDPIQFGEIDFTISWYRRLHQGLGRRRFAGRINRLLYDFPFGTMREAVDSLGDLPCYEHRVPDRG